MSLNYITKKEFLKEFKIDSKILCFERGLPIKKIGYKTYLSKDGLDGWLKDFSKSSLLLNGSRCSMKRGKYKEKTKPIVEKKEGSERW